ncbi:MAG: molybdopterin-dependent oxidoreductase [Spirochaetaceae bacterium]|nr:molybdopterin-dependent oxidoreductase [Spirochaetaceae bacterium]
MGKDREKVDAESLSKGERAYVEDKIPTDACALKMLTSPYAHAWIKSVDCSEAETIPGVVAILTHENCPDSVYTTAGQGYPEPSPYDQRMFPRKVRHVGDRVAAVLAETQGIAEEALRHIKVEYEVLEPVLSIAQAKIAGIKSGAPVIHGGEVSYVAGSAPEGTETEGDGRDDPIIYQFPIHADPHRNLAASAADGIGDMDKGFAAADKVIERTYKTDRVQCTPLEPHVVFATIEAGRLVMRASTQVPWHVRRIVAKAIGISENRVRVIKERVGGGFGSKQDIVVEDVAGYLAWTTGRPVYFRYTRKEEFIASRTRHPMEITVRLGARKDGTLTAILMKLDADTGPYGQHCLTVPMNAISKSLPLLLCDNARFEVKSYYTNLSPAGAYQGYGAPKGSFALQTALAEMADALGIDQLAMIEKNRVRSGATIEILKSLGEGRAGNAVTLGTCGLGEMIQRGREAFGWDKPKPQSTDPDWAIGRGAVIIQQGSGLPGLDAANAEVRLLSDGTLLMLSGGADLGTGLDTVTAKTAAEIMGLDVSDVTVISGDTDITPFDKGAYASSGTYFSGSAALRAAEDLRQKVLEVSQAILGEPVSDLRIAYHGMVTGKRGSISLAELGHRSVQGEGHGELSGYGSFKTDHAAFPYGAHFVQVAVNRRSGEVTVQRYHAYQDCGTPINPALAKGQIYGAVLKSIGHSLYEEMIFDDKGRCLNPNFLDYKIPTIAEVPEDFHVELMPVADEVGPFGAKSVSEISVNGAAPAIAIAIHDAVGVWMREWPFTPARILEALGVLH